MRRLKAPNKLNNSVLFLALCSLMLLASCGSNRQINAGHTRIPNLKTEEILDSLKANQLRCNWLSIKYDVEIKTPKIDDSFKAYVRMKRDSAIWISATYYSVEIARFLITPDTVRYMDRRNKNFYVGDYSFLSDLLLFDANYNLIQNIILGNSDALISLDNKVKSSKEKGQYLISFLKKGQLRRAIRKEERKEDYEIEDAEVVVSLLVNPDIFRVNQTSLTDLTDDRSITVNYEKQEPTCNSYYPHVIKILAKSENEQAEVKTSVIKLTSGKKVSLSFTIPEKYEPLVP
jgi:hypothetical protein